MMIAQIKLLLSGNIIELQIDDETIHAAISLASERYLRFRPNTNPDWGASPRAHSWILEYALAQCRIITGQAYAVISDQQSSLFIAAALASIESLERELMNFA